MAIRILTEEDKLELEEKIAQAGSDSGGNADEIYVLSEGENLDDVPDNVEVVIDPNGEADFDLSSYAKTEDIPTDEHINNLIASALAAMPDASEVAF